MKGRRTVYGLWGFKVFHSKLPKKVKSSGGTGKGNSIQKFKKRRRSGDDNRSGVGKSLIQYNKDRNRAGKKSPLSIITSFNILPFVRSSAEIKKFSIKCKHLVVKCLLKIEDKIIDAHALIDCGATCNTGSVTPG
jgi:hypothetical protein